MVLFDAMTLVGMLRLMFLFHRVSQVEALILKMAPDKSGTAD